MNSALVILGRSWPKLKRNTLIEMLRSIPGVGIKTAITISKEYSSIYDLCAASEGDILSIKDVGPKKAQSIYSHLRGQYFY